MEKENGEGEAGGKQPPPPDGLLDAAGLFGAYWGRDGASAGGAAAAAQAQAAQAALFGFGTRYPPPTTLGVAANQAASLGLHPAASAAWWSMASHLAAQDYLARLQASGLNFPPLGDPYSALSALQGLTPKQQKMSKTGKSQDRSGRSSASSTTSRGESKEKPSSSTSQQPSMRSSYGFPKSSSPSSGHSQSLSSLASLNNLVSGQSKSSKQTMSTHSRNKTHSGHSSHGGGQQSSHGAHGASHGAHAHGAHGTHGTHGAHGASGLKDTLALLHGAGLAGHRGLKGKNMSSLYPFGMPGSEKDRRSGIDSLTGLPHTILSDPASVLGGVRLPPDTEIIKYTSSLAGAKGTPGSTNRGRKKTISLDPPHVSVHPADRAERTERHGSGAKRMKLDEYGNSKSSVEVIRLPNRPDKGSLADTPPPNLADYAGISRELLQTIASQSGVSLAALEKQLAGTAAATDSGLDLSRKPNSVEESPLELGSKTGDEDAPLNLSMKPSPPSNQASDALSRLTSLSSSLSVTNTDRNSLGWPSREGRPRNLGRGVSKPKKNTVASLLAQSRALGLRPALAQQLLAETDLEKLKALLGETGSTDSECPSDSPSDSDASDPGRRPDSHCRMPLAMGWKRSTIIKGLSRNCNIKGDVFYYPPEPHSAVKLRNMQELQAYLEQNPCPPLSAEHFSFSSRRVLGEYTQPPDGGGDTYTFNETEILKRLEEARALVAMSGVHSGHSGRTPPPLDRRMELARQQQREREARKDTPRPRDQARLARELERNERAEMAKKEKEAKSQQLLEAKRRKHEDIEKQRLEEQNKRQQERELKRQQTLLLKEQQKYITEERERRRTHLTFLRQLDARKRWEERERSKHQNLLDRLLAKEKKLNQRRKEMELLSELRRPQEDSTLSDQKSLPVLSRIPGLCLPGEAMAGAVQLVEFLHTFARPLGFDPDSIPSLETLQLGLVPDCCLAAEEELLQVLTHLLVAAIEDPGIPHPGRHTTLLGQAIRLGDITPANISEVLRIYLYANATGEVKALTGLSIERERERRIPDHHQTDSEMAQVISTSKNTAYYEALHCNATYKLSECLRDKPFLALNATAKAKILAYLCDELLQNKAVLRQIDASLENLNQLKKERYLMDMKIRKVRVQYQRKLRTEHSEKQQALALERMQKLVEESTANLSQRTDGEETPSQTPEKNDPSKQRDKESPTPENNGEKDPSIDQTHSPFKTEESDKELSPIKDMTSTMKSKALLNNNKDDSSVEHKDKDSVMGDCDAALSDLESEGTQPEEDEDKNLSSEELSRKLEKLLRQSEQQLQHLYAGSHALRATCYGQDRYWRRYWSFGKCGGIYVEGMESAQPEILDYHRALEEHAVRENPSLDSRKRRKKGAKEKKEIPPPDVGKQEQEVTNEDAIKTEMELKSIKSELNLSDHTQIIKYEPNVKAATKMTGSSIKMEEKFIQQKQNKEEEDMLDIEDSIPTAFLVQKPTLNQKPIFTNQSDSEKPQETIKTDNTVKTENPEPKEEVKDDLVNNLEELRKMAEAVSSQLEAAKKAEEEEKLKEDIKEEKVDIKKEEVDVDAAHETLYAKMLEGKWFSILRHESAFLTNINDEKRDKPVFRDNDQTCAEIITTQGHKWDVSNNLHLLNDPSLFTLNSMVTAVQVPSNNIYLDSSLTMSGLEEDVLNSSVIKSETSKDDIDEEQENDLEIELKADALKAEAIQKAKANSLTSLGLLNYNALSTYVTCDSPPPIQMAPEEVELLESCKANGLPKKLDGNYVPRELRHGWWRITCSDQLKQVMEALHPRGVRERELIQALTLHVPTMANKLYIDKGDPTVTELSVSHTDRAITQNGGFANPDPCGSFSSLTARRVDMQALTMVEQLEERVAAASMQVKGWRPSRCPLLDEASGAELVTRARHKLAGLEAAIERRYLKPPLGQRHTGSVEATICGTGAGTGTESSAESRTTDTADGRETKGISRGLSSWREGVARCNTSAQLAMLARALDAAVAWDKSIMKANCQFCQSGDNEDQLLLCDGCDKGYHTYCFKPRMENIPEGDWYCWECVNKARGARACVVCGGARAGRVLVCALCPRALHPACLAPPLHKIPRGKWYCVNCISRAPPKKPRSVKKRENKHKDTSGDLDQSMVPSPAASHASTSTTPEESGPAPAPAPAPDRPDHHNKPDENGLTHHTGGDFCDDSDAPPEKRRALHYGGNGAVDNDLSPPHNMDVYSFAGDECSADDAPLLPRAKKDKRRGHKELALCKSLLSEMECHEHAWPFLLPVNTKQFPQYKKVIKTPMDLSTIKRKLTENSYKCKDEFAADVRLIFSNCEVFNEDDSPVGRAGHNMRQFFEEKWTQI